MTDLTDEIRLTLRMPANLRDRIASESSKTGRSLNAEIVQRLEESFREEEGLWAEVNRLTDVVGELQRTLDRVAPRADELWSRYQGGVVGSGG